jgi:hypothetical protein
MSYPSIPRTGPRPSSASSRPPSPRSIPWGWLEWFLIAQTMVPALLFVPGISAVRPLIRVVAFGIALGAWFGIVQSGKVRPGASSFAANFWLKITTGWLLLLILHWNTNSIVAGFAHAMLYISVFSPAFWAPGALVSQRQVGRLMMILLVCNGSSALVGMAQVFRPTTFNPPVIQGLEDKGSLSSQVGSYEDERGNTIIRPCGLTDQVGAASPAGATAALIGLAYALRPIGIFKRLMCLILAFFGVAVIYYSQVRMILMMLIICLIVLVCIFLLQKNFGNALMLAGLGAGLIAGALSWVIATSGMVVVERFLGLLTTNFTEKYQESRGGFVRNTFDTLIWEYPAGAGLGWWGTIYGVFGDKSNPSKVWVEVMWPAWVIDGGIPLMVLYVIAILVAMGNSLRIALRSRDKEVAFWAAVVFASNLSVLATCFSYVTFVTAIGLQFWLLSAVLHAADVRVRSAAASVTRPKSIPLPPAAFPPPAQA